MTFKKAKKPDMDAVNLLVSILVCYPEIGTVSYEPKDETLHFSFTLQGMLTAETFQKTAQYLEESILTYHELEGFFGARINFTLEGQGNTAFFHIDRDVETLSRGEINMIANLMREIFEKLLLSEQEEKNDLYEEEEMLREEAIDHMIGSLKASRIHERMIGVREGGRVMVFNK